MEPNPNLYQPEEPTVARLREQFVDFLTTIPDPSEMSDEQLTAVGELVAQVWTDIVTANQLLTEEEVKRGLLPPGDDGEERN